MTYALGIMLCWGFIISYLLIHGIHLSVSARGASIIPGAPFINID